MRGIDRVIAVLLLVGAVGGAAAFARQSGSESSPQGVALSAPPLQHIPAPGTFFIAPRLTSPAKVPPAQRVTIPQATLRRPVQAVQAARLVKPPAPKPTPAPVQTAPPPVQAPPAPAPTPEPPRALAVVQPTVSLPVVPPPTVDSGEGEHGNVNDEQGSTDGKDHQDGGNGGGDNHGHGQGQDEGGGPKHSGD